MVRRTCSGGSHLRLLAQTVGASVRQKLRHFIVSRVFTVPKFSILLITKNLRLDTSQDMGRSPCMAQRLPASV